MTKKIITDLSLLNNIPRGGIPSREFCRTIVTDNERKLGADLVANYRSHEAIQAKNNIPGKSHELRLLEMHSASQVVGAARLRQELAAMSPDAFEQAGIELDKAARRCR